MSKRTSIVAPCRVLIVEDDWLISEVLAAQVSELNLEVAGVAGTVAEALDFLASEDIDAVLLDMKLHERFAGEVAAELQRQGVPFLFVTGYAKAPDPRYDDVPILRKPFDVSELQAALAAILPPPCLPEPDTVAAGDVA
jgi:CheY-like chemotaxis protein